MWMRFRELPPPPRAPLSSLTPRKLTFRNLELGACEPKALGAGAGAAQAAVARRAAVASSSLAFRGRWFEFFCFLSKWEQENVSFSSLLRALFPYFCFDGAESKTTLHALIAKSLELGEQQRRLERFEKCEAKKR